jgi:hypothetical protein
VRIRPLPDIDLARIACMPMDQQRRQLEQMRHGRPPFSYKPLRMCFHDIFNVQPELFGLVQPTAWPIVEGRLLAKCRSEDELNANIAVARGLHDFAISTGMLGRAQDFFSLAVSAGQKVAYWLPMVLSREGRPIIPFIDPRLSRGLSLAARRFVFSMMHEHIRAADPDYESVGLAIFQFGKPSNGLRAPILHLDEGVDLIPLAQLEAMVSATYTLWQDVLEDRQEENRRRAGGAGGSLL